MIRCINNIVVGANGVRPCRTRGMFRAVLTTAAVASLMTASCGGDGDGDGDNGGGIVLGAGEAWLMKCRFDEDEGYEYCEAIAFRNGKVFVSKTVMDMWIEIEFGTYIINGNTITLDTRDMERPQIYTYSVSGDKLFLGEGEDQEIWTKITGLTFTPLEQAIEIWCQKEVSEGRYVSVAECKAD